MYVHNVFLLLLLVFVFSSTTTAATATADFIIVAHLKHRNLAQLEEIFWRVSTPGNSEYLQHRSVSDLASIIGSSPIDISTVSAWLIAFGGSSVVVSPLGDVISAYFSEDTHTFTLGSYGVPIRDDFFPGAVSFVIRRDHHTAAVTIDNKPRPTISSISNPTVEEIKNAYGIPVDLQASNDLTTNMVWGPGTFGYSPSKLLLFKEQQAPLLNMNKVIFATPNHGVPGGDNFGEGQLDVQMISSFGLNVTTLVSNTNTSASTEETNGFGAALLDFVADLSANASVPHILSMSLGSLSAASCDLLCDEISKMGFTVQECNAYMATQRQVCMFLSTDQTERINTYFMALGLRGVTVMGSSGDGGSHFSFTTFKGGSIADALNQVSCKFQIPVFPTASPYILSVGAEMWIGSSSNPVTWNVQNMYGSGGGFSIEFPAPVHQQAAVNAYLKNNGMPPSSSFNASNRAYPDLAAVGVDGTSQSCPLLAGIFSLIIDQRLSKGLPPLGFIAPRIYQIAATYPGEAFEDIVVGNSCTSCDNGFPATAGWDANTGFGRPKWAGLVKYFASDSDAIYSSPLP